MRGVRGGIADSSIGWRRPAHWTRCWRLKREINGEPRTIAAPSTHPRRRARTPCPRVRDRPGTGSSCPDTSRSSILTSDTPRGAPVSIMPSADGSGPPREWSGAGPRPAFRVSSRPCCCRHRASVRRNEPEQSGPVGGVVDDGSDASPDPSPRGSRRTATSNARPSGWADSVALRRPAPSRGTDRDPGPCSPYQVRSPRRPALVLSSPNLYQGSLATILCTDPHAEDRNTVATGYFNQKACSRSRHHSDPNCVQQNHPSLDVGYALFLAEAEARLLWWTETSPAKLPA